MKRIKVGDLIEIKTSKGLVYAQFTHAHPYMGSLVRVKDKFFTKRPENFESVLHLHNKIITFLPLQAMVKKNIVEVVCNLPLLPSDADFPLFRNGIKNINTGQIKWWLWDGVKEWEVGYSLNETQRKYPLQGVWNDTLLIERIEEGWSHETADYF